MSNTVQVTVFVPKELRTNAKIAAAKRGHTISDVLRAALEEYIQETEDAELGPRAQAAHEEWKRDPSTAQPWKEVEAELDT